MFENRLLLIFIIICCSLTLSTVVSSDISQNGRTWDDAVTLAEVLVAQMTLEEKCNMTAGVPGSCVGKVLFIPRLSLPSLCFQDSPSGIGDDVQFATAFAPGIQIAAARD